MKYIKKLYLLFSLLVLCFHVHAQDKIYYKKKKADDWKVTQISANTIQGTDVTNAPVTNPTADPNVLFVFNNVGNFLVIPGLYENPIKGEVYVKQFFERADPNFSKVDKIITLKNDIITGTYQMEKENTIEYSSGNKFISIPKKDVALIIFRDGKHKLFASTEKAYKALRSIQDGYYELAFSSKKKDVQPLKKDTQTVASGTAGTETKKDSASAPVAKSSTTSKDSSASRPPAKPIVVNTSKDVSNSSTNTGLSNKPAIPATKPAEKKGSSGETRLDSATMTNLQQKALLNIKELEGYIRIISDKDTDPDQVSKTIDQAVSLFINEDATVEVSSVKRSDVQQYKIGVYLKRLGLLKYDKVAIEWYDVQYTSRLRKGADGNYYGFIEFEQRFTGISGDNKTYEDITRKTVEIVLKAYEKRRGGETSLEWDVFLGNIGIAVTKSS